MEIDLTKLEPKVKVMLAGSLMIPIEAIEIFSEDESEEVRVSAAANLNATEKILDRASKDKVTAVKVAAIRNLNISGEAIDNAVRENEDDDDVKFCAAESPKAWGETLDYLSHDKHPVIKRNVALNKNTLKKTLVRLANEESDFGILYFVELNENTPKEEKEKIRKKLPSGNFAIPPTLESLHEYYEHHEEDDYDLD